MLPTTVVVTPKRAEKLEMALVDTGFVKGLTLWFDWVNKRNADKAIPGISAYYFLHMLEFKHLPTREPTSDELKSLKALASSVDDMRISARSDPEGYDNYWNTLLDKDRLDLMRLGMTQEAPAIPYLKEVFSLSHIKTGEPKEFTPEGIWKLEHFKVNLSLSPPKNQYEFISDVLRENNYRVKVDPNETYGNFVKEEQLVYGSDPTAGDKKTPPKMPPDPGDPHAGPTTPPEIKPPNEELLGRIR